MRSKFLPRIQLAQVSIEIYCPNPLSLQFSLPFHDHHFPDQPPHSTEKENKKLKWISLKLKPKFKARK